MERKHAVETIKTLVAKKILVKNGGEYQFNKNYEEWVVGKRPLAQGSGEMPTTASGQKPTKSSGQKPTHKRKKETITKETRSKGSFDPLGAEIIKAFEEVDRKNKTYYGNTTQRGACDFLIAEYGLDEVLKRIGVLPQTNKMKFFPTITTPCQLRDKWTQLENAAARKRAELQDSNVFKV